MAFTIETREAAGGMVHSDVVSRLQKAVSDEHEGAGKWAYYVDHNGDDESGDVYYRCDGDTYECPYEMMGGDDDAATAQLDTDSARKVLQTTSYDALPDEDEADHYAAMESAQLYTPGAIPLCERFVSKAERDKMDSADFAGKGQSFPIKNGEDVKAAARSLGRAGAGNHPRAKIKANIIRIAKRKGLSKSLPKAWQSGGDDSKESKTPAAVGDLALCEAATTVDKIVLREARADYDIKLIAPGKGSSAFYPAEVLRRDGPKVFGAGTHVYLNHPTAAEESARPEGDVANLAGVLTTTARYEESHPKGAGLYARMKVFADHAQLVEEKAPYVGMSIRAAGVAESGKQHEGLPILKQLTAADSVDVVTRAGAGGMILTEAAKTANPTQEPESSMTDQEKQIQRRLLERAVKGDATEAARRILQPLSLHEAAKAEVIERCLAGTIPTNADGDQLDQAKWKEAVDAEAKRMGAFIGQLSGGRLVHGMGSPAAAAPTAEDITRAEESAKREEAEAIRVYESLGMPKAAAAIAARGREEAA